MNRVTITGPMASGKSTIARIIAKALYDAGMPEGQVLLTDEAERGGPAERECPMRKDTNPGKGVVTGPVHIRLIVG